MQHPTKPRTHFSIFVFPLFGFWSHFALMATRNLKFWQTGYSPSAHDIQKQKNRCTPEAVGVSFKKTYFLPETIETRRPARAHREIFLLQYSCSPYLKTPLNPISRSKGKFENFAKIDAQTLKLTSQQFYDARLVFNWCCSPQDVILGAFLFFQERFVF